MTLRRAPWRCLSKIDDLGGGLQAVENGFIQREIQESAYRAQRADRHRGGDRGRRQPIHGRRTDAH